MKEIQIVCTSLPSSVRLPMKELLLLVTEWCSLLHCVHGLSERVVESSFTFLPQNTQISLPRPISPREHRPRIYMTARGKISYSKFSKSDCIFISNFKIWIWFFHRRMGVFVQGNVPILGIFALYAP